MPKSDPAQGQALRMAMPYEALAAVAMLPSHPMNRLAHLHSTKAGS